MIEKTTVFVLGAGASVHVGLPVGTRLKSVIIHGVDKGPLRQLMVLAKQKVEDVVSLARLLQKSDVDTPDFLFAARPEFEAMGQQMIAWAIGTLEHSDKLDQGQHRALNPQGSFDDNYELDPFYRLVWNHLHTPNLALFSNNKLRVITFNYDRSFEEYIRRQLILAYGLSVNEASQLQLGVVPVCHVHGHVGFLTRAEGSPAREYGQPWTNNYSNPTSEDIDNFVNASKSVKIATRASKTDSAFTMAQEWLSEADIVAFVGCAYHGMNMDNLQVSKTLTGKTRVHCSSFGLGRAEVGSRLKFLPTLISMPLPKRNTVLGKYYSIGHPQHVASRFVRESVWLDSSVHDVEAMNKLLP